VKAIRRISPLDANGDELSENILCVILFKIFDLLKNINGKSKIFF